MVTLDSEGSQYSEQVERRRLVREKLLDMMLSDVGWNLFPLYTFSLLHTIALSASVSAILLLLFWRLWKFSVFPFLYPNDPKEFPYWTPCKNQ